MKCEICDNKIGETFLGKIIGTHIKDSRGKNMLFVLNVRVNLKIKRRCLRILSKVYIMN